MHWNSFNSLNKHRVTEVVFCYKSHDADVQISEHAPVSLNLTAMIFLIPKYDKEPHIPNIDIDDKQVILLFSEMSQVLYLILELMFIIKKHFFFGGGGGINFWTLSQDLHNYSFGISFLLRVYYSSMILATDCQQWHRYIRGHDFVGDWYLGAIWSTTNRLYWFYRSMQKKDMVWPTTGTIEVKKTQNTHREATQIRAAKLLVM